MESCMEYLHCIISPSCITVTSFNFETILHPLYRLFMTHSSESSNNARISCFFTELGFFHCLNVSFRLTSQWHVVCSMSFWVACVLLELLVGLGVVSGGT